LLAEFAVPFWVKLIPTFGAIGGAFAAYTFYNQFEYRRTLYTYKTGELKPLFIFLNRK
jgi:hypothetical protein